jgi:YVTN family beta-propeller protein
MSQEILFLVEKCSHCVSYYDINSSERLHTIELPQYPHEVAFDSRNEFAYLGHYGVETSGHIGAGGHTIMVIDVKKREHVRTIDVAPYNRLHGMQMDNQDRLYALSEEKAVLLSFDDPKNTEAPDFGVPTGGLKSHLFALSQDGEYAYSMNLLSHTVTKIKPRDALFTPVAVSPGKKPEGYALINNDTQLIVTNRISNTLSLIDTETMQVIKEAPSRNDATRAYQFRDGRVLITNYGANTISVIDPATLEETNCIEVGAKPIALSYHSEKNYAFVSQDNNKVAVLNLDSLEIEKRIETQLEPDVSRVVVE